jgi:spore germination cell wall hydrolase CwlJ-like protein
MNKLAIGVVVTATIILGFQQLEIQYIGNQVAEVGADVREIKDAIVQSNDAADMIAWTAQDETCLAQNIYYEAGVEDFKGKFAVAQVTLNRVQTGKWGRSICDVVHAKAQFSWTLKKNAAPKGKAWRESKIIAHQFLHKSYRMPGLKDATYYHADYVNPKWNKAVVRLQQIGKHIFYQKA